jgi:class 3 adenylate cyclase/tetratricopeptide (TPR) repeat protein
MDALAKIGTFVFEGFRLDQHGLFRRDQNGVFTPIPIGSRALDVLVALVGRAGDLVSRDEIIAAAWPATVIGDNNLNVQIAALRRLLDDGRAYGSCIQTVPGRGYRLVAAVTRHDDAAAPSGPGLAAPDKPSLAVPQGALPIRHGEAERRQVTAMSCELVDMTARPDSMDLEDLRETVGDFQRCVSETAERHQGFVYRELGNSALVLFGYPDAHEYDAEQAIRAGLELCATVRSLGDVPVRCRVGIATGLVIVGDPVGDEAARGEKIIGDAPNQAARLAAAVQPDTVAVGPATRRLIGSLFECRELGAIAAAGDSEPIRNWQVLRESVIESRFEALRGSRLSPLIGRDEEIGLLLRRWGRAKARDGQVVLISGEPGIGKSRITAELEGHLHAEPHIRLRHFCSPYHQDSALYPFVDQLRRASRFVPDDPPTTRLEKLEALLARATPRDEDVAFIADLLALPASDRHPLPNLSSQRKKERTLEALIRQLEGLAHQKPVLMVVEDLHWIDPSSRELLDLTVERAASLPVLLILTFRSEFQAPWSELPQVTALTLNRLDRRSGAAMVEHIAGNRKLPDVVAAEIVERADGVPLFVEELTRAVIEAGTGPGGDALAGDAPLPSSGVPPALHASLVARLDRLGPAAREAAQIGAVLGREFSYGLIAQVAQQRTDANLQVALGALTGAGLLFCRGIAPHAVYLFKHALIQDAAYETLLRARRRELHRTAAQTIAAEFPALAEAQPEVIARHWSEAGEAEPALAAWRQAGDVARARNAFIEAQAAYRHALDMLAMTPPSPERDTNELELLIATSQMILATKGAATPEAVEINARAEELAEKTGNLRRLAEQIYGSYNASRVSGNHPSAMALADQLLDLARRDGSALTMDLATHAQSVTRLFLGDLIGAEKHFIAGEASLSDPGLRGYCVATWTISFAGLNAWVMGRPDEARARIRRAYSIVGDDAYVLAFVHWFSSLHQFMLRQPEQAASLAAQATALADEHGFRDVGNLARIVDGWAQAQLGHADEGVSLIRKALTALLANGALVDTSVWLTWLAGAQALTGALADALRTIEEALTVVPEERWWRPETLRVRGEIWRKEGNDELAEADYRDAIALAREMSAKAWELRAAMSLAWLWCDQGKRAEARDLLTPVYGWFTEGFDTADLKEAKALLDEL